MRRGYEEGDIMEAGARTRERKSKRLIVTEKEPKGRNDGVREGGNKMKGERKQRWVK